MSVEPGYVQSINGGFRGGNEERKVGDVRLGDGKIWTLAYADDVVLISEEEEEMRSMIKRGMGEWGQEAHIRERLKKGATVMSQVWGIGKRKFKKEEKRIWLFDKLVWSDGIWGRNMGMAREGGARKATGKIFEVGTRGGLGYPGIYD
ncbi:hypothetical protein RF55_17722 [Lasius niger]|uniref:Reverse transcriptase domain-containing protein n=1 Tax=Lasius niger TaxID=67767 RepID=A0A0J7K2C9_LASNI|nr:hypothetical protein RF55_17722 [Lasius niger]